ncbi:hypothetical protein OF83DRAFT_1081940 [Amylostereum chailletii]|nr:hypothetical protein OF83DRAFT_1081940 [Amylostereum chailletii]
MPVALALPQLKDAAYSPSIMEAFSPKPVNPSQAFPTDINVVRRPPLGLPASSRPGQSTPCAGLLLDCVFRKAYTGNRQKNPEGRRSRRRINNSLQFYPSSAASKGDCAQRRASNTVPAHHCFFFAPSRPLVPAMGFLSKLSDSVLEFITVLCVSGPDDEGEPGPIITRYAPADRVPAATTSQPSSSTPPTPATPSAPARHPRPYAYAYPQASPANTSDTDAPSQPPISHIPRPYAYVPQRVPPVESIPFAREHGPTQNYNATDRTSHIAAPTIVLERERRPYQQVFSDSPVLRYSSSPPPHERPHSDSNQINQLNPEDQDVELRLRRRANEEGDAMGRAFHESQQAYKRGDRARAKELSEEGKLHRREMEKLHAQASACVYKANNEGRRPGEIDLHGLYVNEAVEYADRAIQGARARDDHEVHLIVGKGLHSENNVAKIRPAIEQLIQRHRLVAALDPTNEGVIVVQLG